MDYITDLEHVFDEGHKAWRKLSTTKNDSQLGSPGLKESSTFLLSNATWLYTGQVQNGQLSGLGTVTRAWCVGKYCESYELMLISIKCYHAQN